MRLTKTLLALAEAWEAKADEYRRDAQLHYYSGGERRSEELNVIAECLRATASTLRGLVHEIEEEEGCS